MNTATRLYNYLRGLQDVFYEAPEFEELQQEVNELYSDLSAKLEREDRHRLLKLIDNSTEISEERSLAAFAAGNIQLLVSTTVIEVGVDVPNAVIMVVENAERFGLAQLHQLRGRVGRGVHRSTCILISDSGGEETRRRLQVMCATNDGFRIADEDLKLRGPGDFFGNRQHGLPDLRIADLTGNMDIVRQSKKACDMILAKDPLLSSEECRPLAAAVDRLFSEEKHLSLN